MPVLKAKYNGEWITVGTGGGPSGDIPEKLPNPHPLTFTGAAEAVYDGSAPVTVEIPEVPESIVTSINGMTGDVILAGDGSGIVVQSDWDQTDETQPDFIKNKPDEMDALALVAELNLISQPAFVDEEGNVYLDEEGNVITV